MVTDHRPGPPDAPWDALRHELDQRWEPGDHFAILGPTKSGKSTLELLLAEDRAKSRRDRGVVVLGTKPRDATLTRWAGQVKAKIVPSWDKVDYAARTRRRLVVWPPYGRSSTAPRRLAPIFTDVIDHIMSEGNWTLVVDEASYLVEQLGMRRQLDELWNAARSNKVTVMAGSQRPVWINRSMVSQMSWLAAFRYRDEDDARRVGEVAGDRARFAPLIQRLRPHHFMLINTWNGRAVKSIVTDRSTR